MCCEAKLALNKPSGQDEPEPPREPEPHKLEQSTKETISPKESTENHGSGGELGREDSNAEQAGVGIKKRKTERGSASPSKRATQRDGMSR